MKPGFDTFTGKGNPESNPSGPAPLLYYFAYRMVEAFFFGIVVILTLMVVIALTQL